MGLGAQELRLQLVNLDHLTNAQVQQDILATTRDTHTGDFSVDLLNDLTLATTRVAVATEEKDGAVGNLVKDAAAKSLGHGHGTAEPEIGLGLAHVAHLVNELVDPGRVGLQLGASAGKAVADDGIVHERLAKGLALHDVFKGGAERNTALANDTHADAHALVVEVGHDVGHAHALLADDVLDGNLDLVHVDKGGAGADLAADLEAAHLDTGVALEGHEEQRQAAGALVASADSHGGVVGPDTVGDPISRG